MPASFDFAPSRYHARLMKEHPPSMRYPGGGAQATKRWQTKLRRKFRELLALPSPKDAPRGPLKVRSLWSREHSLGRIEKIVFRSEAKVDVPAYVCLPKNAARPYPWFICLQGHSTGMHNSIGVAQDDESRQVDIPGDRDFALGCMRRGIAALCIEQRGFGERAETDLPTAQKAGACHHTAMAALMLGRTLMGERVHDIDRAIDYLYTRDDVDRARLGAMGNSGGGKASLYAAAVLPRITHVMPSCSFCTYRDAWMGIHHCACSYVPGVLKYAEFADILALCAPKPAVVVVGEHDAISPIKAARTAFAEAKRAWKALGAERQVELVVGPEGHRFYAELAWPKMLKLMG